VLNLNYAALQCSFFIISTRPCLLLCFMGIVREHVRFATEYLEYSRHCCRAGAARSHIILVEPKPQHDAAPASMATALNLMLNIGGL
jgi:hypothetical protein